MVLGPARLATEGPPWWPHVRGARQWSTRCRRRLCGLQAQLGGILGEITAPCGRRLGRSRATSVLLFGETQKGTPPPCAPRRLPSPSQPALSLLCVIPSPHSPDRLCRRRRRASHCRAVRRGSQTPPSPWRLLPPRRLPSALPPPRPAPLASTLHCQALLRPAAVVEPRVERVGLAVVVARRRSRLDARGWRVQSGTAVLARYPGMRRVGSGDIEYALGGYALCVVACASAHLSNAVC